jgi:hypothetical protein
MSSLMQEKERLSGGSKKLGKGSEFRWRDEFPTASVS